MSSSWKAKISFTGPAGRTLKVIEIDYYKNRKLRRATRELMQGIRLLPGVTAEKVEEFTRAKEAKHSIAAVVKRRRPRGRGGKS